MKLPRFLALILAAATLAGCIRAQSGGEGVFEPTAVEPPSFERGSGLGKGADPAAEPPAAKTRGTRGGLSVPSR